MRIAGVYSFNGGKEAITQQHRAELDEVLQVIETVDAEQCRIIYGKDNVMRDEAIYKLLALNETFKKEFVFHGWLKHSIVTEPVKEYYVPEYTPRTISSSARYLEFVKDNVGLEVQLNINSPMITSFCAKMTIFAKLGVIDCGIEIVPVKAFAEEMSTGVSYFEQFVWDLEHRGVSDIDIPVLILGIDTDGVKPKDLKIAETKRVYLF